MTLFCVQIDILFILLVWWSVLRVNMTQRPLLGAQHVYLDAARPKQMVAIWPQNMEEEPQTRGQKTELYSPLWEDLEPTLLQISAVSIKLTQTDTHTHTHTHIHRHLLIPRVNACSQWENIHSTYRLKIETLRQIFSFAFGNKERLSSVWETVSTGK